MAVVGGWLAEHARDVQLVGGEVLGVHAHEAGVLTGAQGGILSTLELIIKSYFAYLVNEYE